MTETSHKGHLLYDSISLKSLEKSRQTQETESRLMVASGRREGRMFGVSLWGDENVEIRYWWQLHNFVNMLKTTELYTLKRIKGCFPCNDLANSYSRKSSS